MISEFGAKLRRLYEIIKSPIAQWGAPSTSPMRGSARLPLAAGFFNGLLDFSFLSFGSPTGLTSLTRPRTKAEHSHL